MHLARCGLLLTAHYRRGEVNGVWLVRRPQDVLMCPCTCTLTEVNVKGLATSCSFHCSHPNSDAFSCISPLSIEYIFTNQFG